MTEQSEGLATVETENTGEEILEGGANTGQEEKPEGETSSGQGQSKAKNAKQRAYRKLREAEARNAQLAEANRKLEERLSSLDTRLNEIENPPPVRPNRVDFDSEEQYEDALFDWRKDVDSRKSKPASEPTVQPEPTGGDDKPPLPFGLSEDDIKDWPDQVYSASEKYEDFEEVVRNDSTPITEVMGAAILTDPNGAEILYHLNLNPDEAKAIARKNFAEQAEAIKKLSGKFATTQTSAPEPIVPLKGDDSYAGEDPETMTPERYREWSNRRRAKARGR